MRIAKPHWKRSHKCWYVKLGGQFHRLDPDKSKAFDIYKELLSRFNVQSGHVSMQRLTAAQLLQAFLDWGQNHLARSTWRAYGQYLIGTKFEAGDKGGKYRESGFANFLSPNLLVRDLKPYHLENWLDARYSHVGPTTRAGAITAVQRAFNWATQMGYIDNNPLRKVKKPTRENRGEIAFLMPEQWTQIVEAVKSGPKPHEVEAFLDLITVMRLTGCRPQEIRRVEARHLDYENKQWVFPKNESKGKKDRRVVVLGDEAFDICVKLAGRCNGGPIFRNSDGKPWTNFAIACRCRRLSDRLGFKVFAYAIRHTFASEAIIAGADVITVARLMGHVDLTMLNKIYQHVAKDRQHMEATRDKATGRMAG